MRGEAAASGSTPVRLTLVIPSLNCGGAERVMSIMANHWALRGHAVTLITYDDGGEKPFYPLDPWVDHLPLALSSGAQGMLAEGALFWRRVRTLRRALLESRPDAIVSFMESTNVLCVLATTGTGIPLVVSERNDPEKKDTVKKIWKLLRRWAYPLTQAVVVQTERMGDYFRPRLDGKLEVIPNPVMLPRDEDTDEGVDVDDRTVVAMGRLEPQKGFDVLLRAFALMRAVHPDWRLAVYGSGKRLASLTALAGELGLADAVSFPGRVRNPYAVFRRAGIYVLSSRFEGFPNTLCEAMASGAPVIATDCPSGPREIITDGVDGLLVPVENVEALGAAMNRLAENDALRRRLGAQAAAITTRFGEESIMRRWEDVLRRRCGIRIS